MRRSIGGLCIALAMIGVRVARADDDAARAKELLAAIEGGKDRADDVQQLSALAPRVVPVLKEYLGRAHATTVEQRRAVLKAIKAAIPDKSGRFETPQRQKAATTQADDEFDWLAELGKLPDQTMPGLGEVAGDVAAIRALAAARQIDAAGAILDAGFAAATVIYRDECGRRLRQMAPYSLPALTIASQSDSTAVSRYASYQLERLDRQEPSKAMEVTASDEELRVAQLNAFGSSHHREAVQTVMKYVNDDAPRVRAAARAAWLAYVTGPAPRGAPRIHMVLPGGKLDRKLTPKFLTYRELARIELLRVAEEDLGMLFQENEDPKKDPKKKPAPDDPPEPQGIAPDQVDLPAISQQLFAHYDAERKKVDDAAFAAAKAMADGGNLPGAGVAFDRLLAENPDLPQRADTAPVYLSLAQSLEKAGQWDGAAAAYGKAYGVAPTGAQANDAEAGREYALGKALEAAGKDGSANFRRAVALKPDYAPAKAAAAKDAPRARKPWLLYAAAAGAALACAFLIAGLLTRRRRTAA